MASQALLQWQTERRDALDEIEEAHAAVGGHGPGRRRATQQVNQACVVLLTSQFQGYCRDLHSEAMTAVSDALQPPGHPPPPAGVLLVVRNSLTRGRKVDRGNPNPGHLGSDFGHLFGATGQKFWDEVAAHDPLYNPGRQAKLDALCSWRNAIAHQDLARTDLPDLDPTGRKVLRLSDFRTWRRALLHLAISFDVVVGNQVQALTGRSPW